MTLQSIITSANLENFFLDNFEIIYQSPHKTGLEERQIILIGENHKDLVFRRKYSSLIDTMGKIHNVVVLVEGEKSMDVINKNASAQTCFISSDVTIYGWDDSTPKDRYPDIPQIDECVKLFLSYESKLLESESESDPIKSKELKEEALEIYENFMTVENQLDQKVYMKAVKENFPNRTESMIKTIKRVVELHPQSKIFIIAGSNHVEQQETHGDPRMDLSSLYQYLNGIESMAMIEHSKDRCIIF